MEKAPYINRSMIVQLSGRSFTECDFDGPDGNRPANVEAALSASVTYRRGRGRTHRIEIDEIGARWILDTLEHHAKLNLSSAVDPEYRVTGYACQRDAVKLRGSLEGNPRVNGTAPKGWMRIQETDHIGRTGFAYISPDGKWKISDEGPAPWTLFEKVNGDYRAVNDGGHPSIRGAIAAIKQREETK